MGENFKIIPFPFYFIFMQSDEDRMCALSVWFPIRVERNKKVFQEFFGWILYERKDHHIGRHLFHLKERGKGVRRIFDFETDDHRMVGYMKRAKVVFSRPTTCLGLMTFTRRRNVCPRECEKKGQQEAGQNHLENEERCYEWEKIRACQALTLFLCAASLSLFYLIIFCQRSVPIVVLGWRNTRQSFHC